jgi:hypothetical protein
VILSALLSVLALAGAPSATTVQCNPGLAQTADLGVTFSSVITVQPDGRIVPGALNIIQLGPIACGALLYASESPYERLATERMNPRVDFASLLGVGLQVALHEANHVALNSADECLVEKVTRQTIIRLIVNTANSASEATAAEAAATASDAALPASYHGC